jgi:hypothetical protein
MSDVGQASLRPTGKPGRAAPTASDTDSTARSIPQTVDAVVLWGREVHASRLDQQPQALRRVLLPSLEIRQHKLVG